MKIKFFHNAKIHLHDTKNAPNNIAIIDKIWLLLTTLEALFTLPLKFDGQFIVAELVTLTFGLGLAMLEGLLQLSVWQQVVTATNKGSLFTCNKL